MKTTNQHFKSQGDGVLLTAETPSTNWGGLIFFLKKLFLPEKDHIHDYVFSKSDISSFHDAKIDKTNSACIDDQTWTDLDVDKYADILSSKRSIFCRQMLYHRLRTGSSDSNLDLSIARIQKLCADKKQLSALNEALQPLRKTDLEVGSLLFSPNEKDKPKLRKYLTFLQVTLIGSCIALTMSPYALVIIAMVLVATITLQVFHYAEIMAWAQKTNTLQNMLLVAARVGGVVQSDGVLPDYFCQSRKKAWHIRRELGRTSILGSLPVTSAYLDWFFVDNVKHYYHSQQVFVENLDFLKACFVHVAELEVDIALAAHLLQREYYCWAKLSRDPTIDFVGLTHPLMPNAIPLSIRLDHKGAFLSGKNGIGKSSFLRSIGLNLLCGRAFGFSYACQSTIPTLPLFCNLRNEDSMEHGESLYNSELRRAKELLTASENGMIICLIDEIFRGTNHVESVSVATAVLTHLSDNALILVSSHNLVLASLLSNKLTAIYLDQSPVTKVLEIKEGVLQEPNGISLLNYHGFGKKVEKTATDISTWLNEYLIHPTNYPTLPNEKSLNR